MRMASMQGGAPFRRNCAKVSFQRPVFKNGRNSRGQKLHDNRNTSKALSLEVLPFESIVALCCGDAMSPERAGSLELTLN